jgi:hypothetical protein
MLHGKPRGCNHFVVRPFKLVYYLCVRVSGCAGFKMIPGMVSKKMTGVPNGAGRGWIGMYLLAKIEKDGHHSSSMYFRQDWRERGCDWFRTVINRDL